MAALASSTDIFVAHEGWLDIRLVGPDLLDESLLEGCEIGEIYVAVFVMVGTIALGGGCSVGGGEWDAIPVTVVRKMDPLRAKNAPLSAEGGRCW